MKKRQCICLPAIMAIGVMLLSFGGCENVNHSADSIAKYYLHNVSGCNITIVNTHTYSGSVDSVSIGADGYYLFQHHAVSNDGYGYMEVLNAGYLLYIYINDSCYQVDRNDNESCLWAGIYREAATAERESLATSDRDWIRVYELTEENIKSQIYMPR